MKKLINGKVVSIEADVIDLFEKAMEGNITKRMLSNKIDMVLEENIGHMGDIVAEYYITYKKLPYPLYVVEDEIKYATIAAQMQRTLVKKIGYSPKMIVEDKVVKVYSEEGYCIEIASDSWAINDSEFNADGDGEVKLIEYRGEPLYRFYQWCNQRFSNNETLGNFYSFAVPGILDACNRKPMIVKWEIAKLLQFAAVPDQLKFNNKHIINLDNGTSYYVDIYWEGKYDDVGEKRVMIIDTRNNGAISYSNETSSNKVYAYDVYAQNKDSGRLKLKSSRTLFKYVIEAVIGEIQDDIVTTNYHGVISDEYIAIEVASNIYVGKLGDHLSKIGTDVHIINMEGNRVYIAKNIRRGDGAVREGVYAYEIDKDSLKLCDVKYRKDVDKSETY